MKDERPGSDEERRREEINEIGRAIKVARSEQGWSLRRLAEEAGVSASLLSAVETGKIVPTVGSLFAISDALGQPAEAFFPARRQTARSQSAEIVAVQPEPGSDESRTSHDAGRPPEAGSHRSDGVPIAVSSPPPVTVTNTPPRKQTASVEDSVLTRARQPRSINRPARGVARRASPPPSRPPWTDEYPVEPGPAGQANIGVGPGQESMDAPDGASPTPVRGGGLPGVNVRRVRERPTMVLEDGTTWALPVEVSDAIGTVIDVSLPPVSGTPPRYRTRNRVLILLVTRGPLRIEAGFGETMLETGDSIVVGAGVPHRLTGDPHHPTAYLVLVPGTWDGTL